MQTLAEKLLSLERNVVVASRALEFWRKQIELHGEKKAEQFYVHIGLNHIEKKSIEWEGLKLSREPTEIEKLCVKSIASAQDGSQESVGKILLDGRNGLIEQGIKAIQKLTPAEYHELILTVPKEQRNALRDELESVFIRGRKLVASELSKQKAFKQTALTTDDEDELDDLTDLTDSRIANDVQSRITAAASRFALLGLTGTALWNAVDNEINTGSVSYIDRAARGLATRLLNFGRFREAQDRSDEWSRVEYSAILDQNVCSPCAAEDGQSATDESDLTPVPNPDCEGGDWCRCFHVFIAEGIM
jgi:hypothetical protein